MIAFAGSWGWLLLIRFADRVGKGLRTSPRDALLASCAGAERYGLAFGLHRAMDNAGAVIGPLLAFALLAGNVPFEHIFLWAIVPACICLTLSLGIRESAPAAPVKRAPFDWRLCDMPPVFKRYLVVVALFTLGNSSNMFLLLRAKELGMPAEYVPLLWAAVSAVAMICSVPLSALSDRWGRFNVLCGGYLAYGIVYFGMGAVAQNMGLLFLLFAFYGVFMGATEGVEKALVADLVPEGRRGTAFGWFNLTAGLFLLPASMLFGFLYQGISPACAFTFSGCCAVTAASLLKFFVAGKQA